MSKETDRANRLCNLQYTNNAGKPSLGPIREGGDIVCCICCKQKDVAYEEYIYIYIYGAYFSGRFRSGKSSCKIFNTSEECITLPTKQYLPLADGFSKASI